MNGHKWEWLRTYMRKNNISQQQAADALQWKKTRISELLSGKRDLPVTKVFLAADFFNLDLEELTKYNTGLTEKIPSQKGKIAPRPASSDIIYLDILDSATYTGNNLKSATIGRLPFDRAFAKQLKLPNLSALKIIISSGDDMAPTINDKDIVIVDTSVKKTLTNGLYLFNLQNELFIKRLSINQFTGEADIISDNSLYPTIKIDNLKDLSCLGKIIFVCKRFS
jgi:phage repressor protein C with HTH and peptisase S24 domain